MRIELLRGDKDENKLIVDGSRLEFRGARNLEAVM
jgi:hypothetical protein